jgi:hypothetical protein
MVEIKFKITFANQEQTFKQKEEEKKRTRAIIKNTANGILSKLLVFLFEYKCCSSAELSELLTSFYKTIHDKSNINRYLQTLVNLNLVASYDAFFLTTHTHAQDPTIQLGKKKHEEYLEHIPTQFHKKFANINYYYLTENALEYIPWACEVIGFKCEEEKKDD